MRELGLRLNPQHGGPNYLLSNPLVTLADSLTNCKPNHPGVMSYSRQMGSYGDTTLDFSHGGLLPLTESSLTETKGNPVSSISGYTPTIIWGTPAFGALTFSSQAATPLGGTPGNINWDGINGISTLAVNAMISNFGITGCNELTSVTTPYNDYNDWGNLDFNFRQTPAGTLQSIYGAAADSDISAALYAGQLAESSKYNGPIPPPNPDGTTKVNLGATLPLKFDIFKLADNSIVQQIFDTKGNPLLVPSAQFDINDGKGYTNIGKFVFLSSCNCFQVNWVTTPKSPTVAYLKFNLPIPASQPALTRLLVDPAHPFTGFDGKPATIKVTFLKKGS